METARPPREAAAPAPPRPTTTSTPATVGRVSSVPPSAPKAMPARAAPSISGTASGTAALAATLEKRDTQGGQLRQERDSCQRRYALAHGRGAAGHREQSQQDQGDQQRQGHL